MSKVTIPGWARPLLGLALVVLLSPTTPASAAQEKGGTTSLNKWQRTQQEPSNQKVRIHFPRGQARCLRVTSAGVRTRNSSTPTAGGDIVLGPEVTAGSVVWAGLYWDILANAPPPNAVTLNGAPVAPVALPVTVSPCWAEISAFAYFADVTALVVPGVNSVAGLDDSGALNVSPESEGASLVVIYRSMTSSACEIIVTDGNDVTTLLGQSFNNPLPVTCPDQPASLHFIGGDGQTVPLYPFSDDQEWNFVPLGDGDDFDASDPATPGTTPDLAWDTDRWGVVTSPPNVATLSIPAFPPVTGDCINWLATVLEVGVVPDNSCGPVPTEKNTWGRMKSQYR